VSGLFDPDKRPFRAGEEVVSARRGAIPEGTPGRICGHHWDGDKQVLLVAFWIRLGADDIRHREQDAEGDDANARV